MKIETMYRINRGGLLNSLDEARRIARDLLEDDDETECVIYEVTIRPLIACKSVATIVEEPVILEENQ